MEVINANHSFGTQQVLNRHYLKLDAWRTKTSQHNSYQFSLFIKPAQLPANNISPPHEWFSALAAH